MKDAEGWERIGAAPQPKLVGVVRLPFPRVKAGAEFHEKIDTVAFDSDGVAWGLVERATPLPSSDLIFPDHSRAFRLTFDRWVVFQAIPFMSEEIVTADTWPNPVHKELEP